MCTVTYIPTENGIFITSNRDEKINRKPASFPVTEKLGESVLLFPQDGQAGGSWIALKNNGDTGVLLNGGYVSHTPTPPYRKSRGLIFLSILHEYSPIEKFKNIDLIDIEPFTLILFENKNLFECRWDGTNRHVLRLNQNKEYIWSSATLYSKEISGKRSDRFKNWRSHTTIDIESILAFHEFRDDNSNIDDICLDQGLLKTVSVTSITIGTRGAEMTYKDMLPDVKKRKTSSISFDTKTQLL